MYVVLLCVLHTVCFHSVAMTESDPNSRLPTDSSLIDLLLDGQFRDLLCHAHSSSIDNDKLLAQTAITYIDSDWNIFSLIYHDLIKCCQLVCDEISKLHNDIDGIIIENVTTADQQDSSESYVIAPVCVIYGDCAQWTPVFMIGANLAKAAFYSVDKQDQLKEALRQLPKCKSILRTFICHKYRFDELCLILNDYDVHPFTKKQLFVDYYLIHVPEGSIGTVTIKKELSHLNVAYMINTSGTSGSLSANVDDNISDLKSKYIFVPHQAIASNVIDFKHEYQLTPADSVFIISPFTFDPSICDIFLTLSSWSHLVLASSTARNSVLTVQRIFSQFGITHATVTPSLWRKFSSNCPQLCQRLRCLSFGGEPSVSIDYIETTILPYNSNIRLYNLYGLTEISAWASIFSLSKTNICQLKGLIEKHKSDTEFYFVALMPILGRSLRDTLVYLENDQIVIESNRRRCLILNTDRRWTFQSKYYTGDCGHQFIMEPSLELIYFTKRSCHTDFVKLNGVKCYLGMIELTILNLFALNRIENDFYVSQCIALPGDWHEWKQSVVDLVVAIGHRKQTSLDQAKSAILQHLSHLPFAFRCHLFDQSTASSVMLSSNGKLDVGKLRRQLQLTTEKHYIPIISNDLIESKVYSIISSTLGTDVETIKANADKQLRHFGLQSMAALQILMEIEQTILTNLRDTTSHNLFEVILTANTGSIVSYICQLITPTGDSIDSNCVTNRVSNLTNFSVNGSKCNPQQTNIVSRHCQLHNLVNLKEEKHITEPVSISHQWSFFMDECVDATPLIVACDQVTYLIAASHSGLVIALDLQPTHYRQLWSNQLAHRIESSPVASGDGHQVYVSDYSGLFYCLELETGQITWSYQTGDQIKCTPTLANEASLILCGSYDHHLYCWHQYTGQLKWKVNVNNSAIFSSAALWLVGPLQQVLCCTLNGTVACLALADGTVQWKRSISSSPIFSTPLVINDNEAAVIGLTEGAIVSISLRDGQVRWKTTTDGPIFCSPIHFECSMKSLAIVGTHGRSVICFCTHSGAIQWKHVTQSVVYSSAFLVGHTAIVVESDGILHLLHCQTGRAISIVTSKQVNTKVARVTQYSLPSCGQVFSSPIYSGGKVLLGSRDSCLHCLEINALDENQ